MEMRRIVVEVETDADENDLEYPPSREVVANASSITETFCEMNQSNSDGGNCFLKLKYFN